MHETVSLARTICAIASAVAPRATFGRLGCILMTIVFFVTSLTGTAHAQQSHLPPDLQISDSLVKSSIDDCYRIIKEIDDDLELNAQANRPTPNSVTQRAFQTNELETIEACLFAIERLTYDCARTICPVAQNCRYGTVLFDFVQRIGAALNRSNTAIQLINFTPANGNDSLVREQVDSFLIDHPEILFGPFTQELVNDLTSRTITEGLSTLVSKEQLLAEVPGIEFLRRKRLSEGLQGLVRRASATASACMSGCDSVIPPVLLEEGESIEDAELCEDNCGSPPTFLLPQKSKLDDAVAGLLGETIPGSVKADFCPPGDDAFAASAAIEDPVSPDEPATEPAKEPASNDVQAALDGFFTPIVVLFASDSSVLSESREANPTESKAVPLLAVSVPDCNQSGDLGQTCVPEGIPATPSEEPTTPVFVKASTQAIERGARAGDEIAGQQIRLFPQSVSNVALPVDGQPKLQDDHDEDPVQGVTDNDGSLVLLFPSTDDPLSFQAQRDFVASLVKNFGSSEALGVSEVGFPSATSPKPDSDGASTAPSKRRTIIFDTDLPVALPDSLRDFQPVQSSIGNRTTLTITVPNDQAALAEDAISNAFPNLRFLDLGSDGERPQLVGFELNIDTTKEDSRNIILDTSGPVALPDSFRAFRPVQISIGEKTVITLTFPKDQSAMVEDTISAVFPNAKVEANLGRTKEPLAPRPEGHFRPIPDKFELPGAILEIPSIEREEVQ